MAARASELSCVGRAAFADPRLCGGRNLGARIPMLLELVHLVVRDSADHPATAADPWLPLDMDELLEAIGNTSAKQSMQFTIRALIINGMIEKLDQQRRRGRLRAVYEATVLGKGIAAPVVPTSLSMVEPEPGSIEEAVESLL